MKKFPAKILLFGEYTIIKGSAALALPLSLYEGSWEIATDHQNASKLQQSLPQLLDHLNHLNKSNDLQAKLDLKVFSQDLSKGLYFASTIPGGYGAGSSGALCAAIYQRYQLNPPQEYDLLKLKKALAQIESFFHGASSGIDPLVCFLKTPLHILSKESIFPVDLPGPTEEQPVFFLLNTNTPRKTEPLVNIFLEKCKSEKFTRDCLGPLQSNNDLAISHFLSGDWKKLQKVFRQISQLQLSYFQEMIPEPFQELWSNGLMSEDYHIKLCGAGGGGFLLGLTNNWDHLKQKIQGYDLQKIEW